MTDSPDSYPDRATACTHLHTRRYGQRVIWTAAEIKSRREARGLKQQQLADAVGASRRAVINWEQGIAIPQGRFVAQLEAVLGDDPDEGPAAGLLLRDASFADTLNHLVDLHNDAVRSGINRVLRVEDTPLPPNFHEDHDVTEGPHVDDLDADEGTSQTGRTAPKE